MWGLALKSTNRCDSGFFCDTGSIFNAPSADSVCPMGNGNICPIGSSCSSVNTAPVACADTDGLYSKFEGGTSC